MHTEKVGGIFLTTFAITLTTVILFLNWGRVTDFFKTKQQAPAIPNLEQGYAPADQREQEKETVLNIHGFRSGVLANYQINGQATDQYIRFIRQIPSGGYAKGLQTAGILGVGGKEVAKERQEVFLSSILLSTELSKGYHLTPVRQTRGLQKSVLSTYYLGEKTVTIDSTLKTDAKLLGQINNALSIDIFQYLNQSASRADSLNNYVNLLKTLEETAQKRQQELVSVISFLNANFQAQETIIDLSEEAFFQNLEIFDGENAEEELGKFIGVSQQQSEVKAKIGAYEGLRGYYEFFIPKLENLIRAIQANRDPLIAGVKVVEIQNMTLPLIIRER